LICLKQLCRHPHAPSWGGRAGTGLPQRFRHDLSKGENQTHRDAQFVEMPSLNPFGSGFFD
jgi:hypothetical protein